MSTIGFELKKILGVLLSPMPLFFIALAIAGFLMWRGYNKAGVRLSATALIVMLFLSTPITSRYLIWPIEFKHPKLALDSPQQITELQKINPRHIVVLGCWHNDDDALPLVAKIHKCSLPRVVQGVKLWRLFPEATLLFSGHTARNDGVSHPEISARLAMDLGVPEHKILKVIGAKDTEDGINLYKHHIANTPFIVVSSATHMERVLFLYRKHGLEPILSPAEYASAHGHFSWQLFVPDAMSLYQSERAIYELLGNAWVKLKSLF